MSEREVIVIGAGLTGLTAAHVLARRGAKVTVYERDFTVGGHSRSEWMRGVPYEPHGAHIFHTNDETVWRLVTSLVEMVPYRHRVQTEVQGRLLSWPIQYDELEQLDEWPVILKELGGLTGEVDATNFETWCVSQMGETLYGMFIDGYTTKQWGAPGHTLSSAIGPKRVELRTDGCLDLFRDRYQGWPRHGYGALAEALVEGFDVVMGETITIADVPDIARPGVPVIVTAALDDFCCELYGPLEWRGVRLVAQWHPGTGFAQPAMVVNRPDIDVPYTRTIESKHALGAFAERIDGTVVMYEYPGAPAKHYPVLDAADANVAKQLGYELELRKYERNPLLAAGRLARYTYINMDEAMRDGLVAAARVGG